MPTAIPDRFRLEMRLGRDDDIEEWLATDTSLDRPVLVRTLGPETSSARRQQFVGMVGAVAAVTHPNLARVFAVGEVPGGCYAILEYSGGSTLADHLNAGRGIELSEFLPNAAGLAGAVAALHQAGLAHGAIDPSAITYSINHPAKLGAFGRIPRNDMAGDVVALGRTLEMALTVAPPGGPPPSERIDGLSPVIDRILRGAQHGEYTAEAMEEALMAAPTPREPKPEPRAASRRLLYAAAALLLIAAGLVALGYILSEPATPVLPGATTTTAAP